MTGDLIRGGEDTPTHREKGHEIMEARKLYFTSFSSWDKQTCSLEKGRCTRVQIETWKSSQGLGMELAHWHFCVIPPGKINWRYGKIYSTLFMGGILKFHGTGHEYKIC